MYLLNDEELLRLKKGITAAFATPFVDDIEDYVWEAIFSYVKHLPLVDPLTSTRNKRLFDVIDHKTGVGWSAKALRMNLNSMGEFELVIQRADILKKRLLLGLPDLSLASPPQELGLALLKHWYTKVYQDAELQNVQHKRVCILLKSRNLKRFALYEEDLAEYQPDELIWNWTDYTQTGLQGIRSRDGFCVFRWYPNQKQLFERFRLTENTPILELNPRRLPLAPVVDLLVDTLNRLE